MNKFNQIYQSIISEAKFEDKKSELKRNNKLDIHL